MKPQKIKFNKPCALSKNQLAYLQRSTTSWFNVAEGG